MNTKQFKYILTLAHEGSFSKASDTLNISQPSLSQYIKKIEKEIGLELFDRGNGDVRLTDAGQIYVDAGRRILDIEHQMEVQFSDIATHKTGSLIIGAAPYRTIGMMPIIAKRFLEIHPGMHLVIHEGTTAELTEGMAHGEYDLCLTMLPIDNGLFAWENVMEEDFVLAVPAGFPPFSTQVIHGRQHPAVDARMLNGQRFVMLTDTQFMQKQLERLSIDNHIILHTAAVVKSLDAQIAMVKAGVGMALMPSGIERLCGTEEVVVYSILQELPKREVVVMWRKDRKLSQVAQELKEVICSIEW